MGARFAGVLLLACLQAANCVRPDPSVHLTTIVQPPSWPESYTVSYVFSLPYTAEYQPKMVSYDVTLHRDVEDGHPRVRMETMGGVNALIGFKDTQYELVPRLDKQVCRVTTGMEEDDTVAAITSLPDVADWEFSGQQEVNGAATNLWIYERKHEAKTVQYKFYASPSGDPVRLHMLGNDLFSGAHYDEWIADYTGFSPGRPDPSLFEKPALCSDTDATISEGPSPAALRMRSMEPVVRYGGDAGYDSFLAEHGARRRHASLKEYSFRRDLFTANAAMIESHNAAKKSYTMKMNRFGDWTREEFKALMLHKHSRQSADANGKQDKHELPYEPLAAVATLPGTIDYRGTGADTGVKDQANCGSCWAFGASQAMESSWWKATGQTVRFSEQQIMDCSWGYVPKKEESASGCDGGDAWAGIGHIVEAAGIAASDDYPYLGQNDYCKEDSIPKAGKFKGFARIPRYNESALMEAVYSRGPVAVSLDASQDSFTFYSSGIYYDTQCMWKPDDLDHSMMLMGYGSDPEAGDYWIVKNSWSR